MKILARYGQLPPRAVLPSRERRRVTGFVLLIALTLSACAGESRAADPEALDWFKSYLEFDTTNPPGNEALAAGFLRDILHREGIATRLLVSPAGRTSLYARLEPTDPVADKGALLLTHHIDVVPAGPDWSVEPFSGLERDGWIWGRGAVDVKSLGIAQLAAFVELHRAGGPTSRAVIFLAVADEESGGSEGTAWLHEAHPDLFEDTAAVLGEGGANRVIGGKQFWWGIETAQKRPLWLKATASGRGGHGSMLNPASAPHQLVLAASRLLARPRAFRVTPEARRYLEAAAPYQSDFFQRMVRDLDDIVDDEAPNERLFPGVANQLLDTIQINVIEGGERINVIPEEVSALIDIRLLPDADEEAMLEEVRGLLGDHIDVEVLLKSARAKPSPTDNDVYRCLERSLSSSAPVVPAFIPGVTDARYYRERGVPAYGFSPFALGPLETSGIHGADERISRRAFLAGLEVYSDVVNRCSAS